jgi:hypothetical protein
MPIILEHAMWFQVSYVTRQVLHMLKFILYCKLSR